MDNAPPMANRSGRATQGRSAADASTGGRRVPLVRSKLAPPQPRKGIAGRGQLLDRLREGRGRRLTLVCAPAGYGKTTLLAQWCAADRAQTPFAWLSADEGDGDPIRLWSHLIAGLQTVHPRAGTTSLEALRAGPAAVASVALPLLLEELSDAPPSTLVVDDWHRVGSTVCAESLRLLVEQAPADVQIVVSSRSDPNLPVGRWRAHGELSEVRAADLRLSHAEAASLLATETWQYAKRQRTWFRRAAEFLPLPTAAGEDAESIAARIPNMFRLK